MVDRLTLGTFAIFLIPFLLTGCASNEVTTKTVEIKVPVMYCPAPPELKKPSLPLVDMTEDQIASDGELAKHYKASIYMLIQYSRDLELVIDKYREVSKAYEEADKEITEK